MKTLILKAKTSYAKECIKKHGDHWDVDREEQAVVLLGGAPGMLIVAKNCECKTCIKWGRAFRWLRTPTDPNFKIVGVNRFPEPRRR